MHLHQLYLIKNINKLLNLKNPEEFVQAFRNYGNNPSIQMQLKKLNHGISVEIKDNTAIFDVAVQLGRMRDITTVKDAETVLRNALSIAIKSHQPKIHIRNELYNLLPDTHPIKKIAKEYNGTIRGGAGDGYEIPVYAQPDPRIDNVDINSPVIKEVMEYLFNAKLSNS